MRNKIEMLKDAFLVQNACNIKGVTNSLNELLRELDHISDIQSSPEVKMYLGKILDLLGIYSPPKQINEAYDFAGKQLKELSPQTCAELVKYGLGYCSKQLEYGKELSETSAPTAILEKPETSRNAGAYHTVKE